MSPTDRASRSIVTPKGGPLAVAVWMLCAAAGSPLCGETARGRLVEDPETQTAIEATVSAIVSNDDEAAADRFAALETLAGSHREALLLQMSLYLAGAAGDDRGMAGAVLMRQLGFTPKETIDAVVPRLEDADRGLRRVFTGLLAEVDRRAGGEADFRVYDGWLAARPGRPSAAFVSYLYGGSAEEAVLLMQRVYGRPSVLQPEASRALEELKTIAASRDVSRSLTEGERTRAGSALATLAADPAWWVRRYAATVLRDDATLGTAAILEGVKGDPDALVREGLTRLK